MAAKKIVLRLEWNNGRPEKDIDVTTWPGEIVHQFAETCCLSQYIDSYKVVTL